VDTERLLGELSSSPDLEPFVGLVRPLSEYDRERRSDLIRTLRVYFGCGTNTSLAADRLFLHRNSMLYRLDRIRELTGLDPRDHRVALALQLGLLAMERGDPDAAERP